MAWDNDKVLIFVKEYERRPMLWKRDHGQYYSLLDKEDAWREIADILEEDTEDLKKKMESLRGARRRERSRIRKSVKPGQERYVSNWFCWESFKFLDDQDGFRRTLNNHLASENEGDEDNSNTGDSKNNDDIFNNKSQEDSMWDIATKLNNKNWKTQDERIQFGQRHRTKKVASKRKSTEDPRVIKAYNVLTSTQRTVKNDECTLFGDYIAEKLRKLDHRQRSELQYEIHSLVFQAEMLN